MIYEYDLDVELRAVEKLGEEWRRERQALDELVHYCTTEKQSPPNGYWEAEHRARARYMTALDVLEALEASDVV